MSHTHPKLLLRPQRFVAAVRVGVDTENGKGLRAIGHSAHYGTSRWAKTASSCATVPRSSLARISHHLTAEARDKAPLTSLRLLTVLTVLFEYASAR